MNNRVALPPQLRIKMLDSVLEFMNGSGMSESTIRESVEESLLNLNRRLLSSGTPRGRNLQIGNENISAELLRMWHRDSRYIDNEARPRPLSLDKGRDNLRSILKKIDATADPMQILREMKTVRLIRRTSHGKYLPNSESAIVGTLHPLAIDHIAKLVIRLVSTVSRNLDPSGKPLKLIERHAYTPDLTWSERAAFADFTRLQGKAFLESVDNWLEQRRLRRANPKLRQQGQKVAASVHLFAYLGDDDDAGSIRASPMSPRNGRDRIKPTRRSSRKNGSTPAREARA